MKKTRRKRRRSGFGVACAALVLAVACGFLTAAVADGQAPVPVAEADKAEIHADKTAQLSGEASVRLSVPALCQYPELPTGCEATAAVMVLQYYGEAITPSTLAGEWLTCSEQFYWKNGVLYGPDPDKAFAGDPFSQNAYGLFCPGDRARCEQGQPPVYRAAPEGGHSGAALQRLHRPGRTAACLGHNGYAAGQPGQPLAACGWP